MSDISYGFKHEHLMGMVLRRAQERAISGQGGIGNQRNRWYYDVFASDYQHPHDQGPAMVASRWNYESTMRVEDAEAFYHEVSDHSPLVTRIKGMPEDTEYPLPAGTPLFISFLTADVDPRHGVTGTVPMDDPVYAKRIYNFWRTYVATRVIPKMGKSLLRDSTSRFGVIEHYVLDSDGRYVKDAHGRKVMERVTCTEIRADGSVCGGHFRRDEYGDAVCINCGIILSGDLAIVEPGDSISPEGDEDVERTNYYGDGAYMPETIELPSIEEVAQGPFATEIAAEYVRVKSELDDTLATRDRNLGGASLTGALGARERAIAAFEAKLQGMVTPASEVKAKERAHEVKSEHVSAMGKARRKPKQHAAHEVYEGKWATRITAYHTYRVLSAVRDLGVSSLREVYKLFPDMDAKLVYRRVEYLVESGRLAMEDNGGIGKGKIVTLTYIGKPVTHRAAQVQVMPTLRQVAY